MDELQYAGTDFGSDLATSVTPYSSTTGTVPTTSLNGNDLTVTTVGLNDGLKELITSHHSEAPPELVESNVNHGTYRLDLQSNLNHYKDIITVQGRISFKRRKTKQEFSIKVTNDLQDILNFYTANKSKNDFIFPLAQGLTSVNEYKKLTWSRKRYNMKLRQLGELCGIEETLTSYVSRHSFASLAKNNDIPVTAISEMLGHTSIKTTQIYLDSLGSDRLDDYNEEINGLI